MVFSKFCKRKRYVYLSGVDHPSGVNPIRFVHSISSQYFKLAQYVLNESGIEVGIEGVDLGHLNGIMGLNIEGRFDIWDFYEKWKDNFGNRQGILPLFMEIRVSSLFGVKWRW